MEKKLSFKEVAVVAEKVENEIGLTFDDILNKFTQEVGELNDAVQKYRGRFCKEREFNNEHVKEEVGDVMLNLISICNRVSINPEELPSLANDTLNKFVERKEIYKENLK